MHGRVIARMDGVADDAGFLVTPETTRDRFTLRHPLQLQAVAGEQDGGHFEADLAYPHDGVGQVAGFKGEAGFGMHAGIAAGERRRSVRRVDTPGEDGSPGEQAGDRRRKLTRSWLRSWARLWRWVCHR